MQFKNPQKAQHERLLRRRLRVRSRVNGTATVPRLSVSRSLSHVRAQAIDDVQGKTLVSANDIRLPEALLARVGERKGKMAHAYAVGLLLAERAKEQGITAVVFDRGGRKYHGRIAALAEGARDGGLLF